MHFQEDLRHGVGDRGWFLPFAKTFSENFLDITITLPFIQSLNVPLAIEHKQDTTLHTLMRHGIMGKVIIICSLRIVENYPVTQKIDTQAPLRLKSGRSYFIPERMIALIVSLKITLSFSTCSRYIWFAISQGIL